MSLSGCYMFRNADTVAPRFSIELCVVFPSVGKTGNDAPVEGLSVQRLTLLGRIDVARVVIDRLRLHDEMNSSRETTPTKGVVNRGRVKGKPPRPVRTKKAR